MLIRVGREETFIEPREAEHILELALEVSLHLDCSFYGRDLIEDMRARAWGHIANARRVRMEFQASEEAFHTAFLHLSRGTEDPLEKAGLLDLQASLRRTQQRFEEAVLLSRRAIRVFQKTGESQLVGRALVAQAVTCSYSGNPTVAISLLHQALPLIDPSHEPRLALCAMNNLVDNFASTGRLMEAQKTFARALPLYRKFSEPLVQGRRLWMEGRLAKALGQRDQAVALLLRARDHFASEKSDFETDWITRDLDLVHAAGPRERFEPDLWATEAASDS